jgi:hypothetical protein
MGELVWGWCIGVGGYHDDGISWLIWLGEKTSLILDVFSWLGRDIHGLCWLVG